MNKRGILWGTLILLAGYLAVGLKNELTVRSYAVESEKIRTPVRLALISDLHSCRYGEGMEQLIRVLSAQNPDVIALTGDIFDDVLPDDHAADFLAAASRLCPCLYVTGNHEHWCDSAAFAEKMRLLDRFGVTRLGGEMRKVEIRGETVCFFGVDDPACGRSILKQIAGLAEARTDEYFEVLLSHRPERMDLYAQAGFDLVLCGHAHGGQWRFPGLINGVFAPNQGLFPRYAGGMYRENGVTMIVSRGLARESTRVPRFYNPPEIVMIEIQ